MASARASTERSFRAFANKSTRDWSELLGSTVRAISSPKSLSRRPLLALGETGQGVGKFQSPTGWVYRVAINLSHSYLRRKVVERRTRSELQAATRHGDKSTDLTGALAVRAAVRRLPRRPRTALVLRFFLDLSVQETAEVMQCPEGTVKSLTRKGLSLLRQDVQWAMEEAGDVV